jgi:hypothetical protein
VSPISRPRGRDGDVSHAPVGRSFLAPPSEGEGDQERGQEAPGQNDAPSNDGFGVARGGVEGLVSSLECDAGLADVAESLARILLEATSRELPKRSRHIRGQELPLGASFEDGRERVRDRRPVEELSPREHLEEDDTVRPDVCALVDALAPRLFRRHVGGGSEDHAGRRLVP